jgi:rhodanese-related sulfurtransferase
VSEPPLSVAELLAAARQGLERVTPEQAATEQEAGVALVDIRNQEQIDADGRIPGTHAIRRNVLEWRLEPGGEDSIPELARPGNRVIVLCDAGYASSLAAAGLRLLGLDATDLEGGFQAWRKAGLPVEPTGRSSAPIGKTVSGS